MPTRFRDHGESYYSIDHSLHLVRCPRCTGLAKVIRVDDPWRQPDPHDPHNMWWPRRLVCTACSYTRTRQKVTGIGYDQARDAYFGLPLWLQAPYAKHVLWAWNVWHLDFVERFVGADLRERTPNVNISLASSLPQWLKSAKHRDEVLRAIRRLRATLPEWALTVKAATDSGA
jgi:hypothetical protein